MVDWLVYVSNVSGSVFILLLVILFAWTVTAGPSGKISSIILFWIIIGAMTAGGVMIIAMLALEVNGTPYNKVRNLKIHAEL